MSKYELGRDLQELRSRIERLESGCDYHGISDRPHESPWRPGSRPGRYDRPVGFVSHSREMGVDIERKPVAWKADKAFKMPPVMSGMLGFGRNLQFDAAQSQTWGCVPEPLILSVTWDAGGTDEYYRLTDQVFSIMRVMDPNTGTTTATAIYSAQLIASGRARYPDIGPFTAFNGTLRNAGGAALAYFGTTFLVGCQDNKPFNVMGNFAPGLYDLVAGATWYITGSRVNRC